jgi:cell division transport system permease protein
MTRTLYIVKELLRNVSRHPWTALSSLLSLTLLFLLFQLFWVAAGTSEKFYRDLLAEIRVEVFVSEDFSDERLQELQNKIQKVDGVTTVEFVSRDLARQRLAGHLGVDPLVGYDSLNPLPRSYVLAVDPDRLTTDQMEITETALAELDGVLNVAYSRGFLAKAEHTSRLIGQVGLGLGALILLAALISSANSIRLMTRARAVGFRQLALLGAGKSFVGLPFMLEGLFLSIMAAAASWGIILYGHSRVSFAEIIVVIPTMREIAWFCVVVGMVGFISGYVGIRRSLK